MRCNLPVFKEKTGRIFTAIRARELFRVEKFFKLNDLKTSKIVERHVALKKALY